LETEVSEDDVASWIDELRRSRLIECYRAVPVGQRKASDVLAVRSWAEHQVINRPRPSVFPARRKRRRASTTSRGALMESSRRSHAGREVERKGKEVEGSERVEVDGQATLFDDPAPSPNGDGGRSPWTDKPNPWSDLEPIEEP
jgi:hypothetical protein